tara:strand:- start:1475 stop:1936 length:462 start_codon:yes stop_codon:yes gene_type:complete
MLKRYFCCKPVIKNDPLPPNWKNTKPFVPPLKEGIVIKVYDGDTITIAAKLPFAESPVYRWSVRLLGIDTPEMKSKDEKLKKIATKARDTLSGKIMGKTVYLENVGTEKFGRILANVIFEGKNLNNWLLEEKLAYEYKGGTKLTEEEQMQLLS